MTEASVECNREDEGSSETWGGDCVLPRDHVAEEIVSIRKAYTIVTPATDVGPAQL